MKEKEEMYQYHTALEEYTTEKKLLYLNNIFVL